MRNRQEIMEDLAESSPDFRPSAEKVIAEMLLDLRDLLANPLTEITGEPIKVSLHNK